MVIRRNEQTNEYDGENVDEAQTCWNHVGGSG
jgi:hypothetical protein